MMLLETCALHSPCGGSAMSLTGDKHGFVLGRRQARPWLPAEFGCLQVSDPLRPQLLMSLFQFLTAPSPVSVLGSIPDPWSWEAQSWTTWTGLSRNCPASLPHKVPSYPLCHTRILKTEQHQLPPRHQHLNKNISCTKLHPQTYPE